MTKRASAIAANKKIHNILVTKPKIRKPTVTKSKKSSKKVSKVQNRVAAKKTTNKPAPERDFTQAPFDDGPTSYSWFDDKTGRLSLSFSKVIEQNVSDPTDIVIFDGVIEMSKDQEKFFQTQLFSDYHNKNLGTAYPNASLRFPNTSYVLMVPTAHGDGEYSVASKFGKGTVSVDSGYIAVMKLADYKAMKKSNPSLKFATVLKNVIGRITLKDNSIYINKEKILDTN